jgi:SSS family solute:Na+ symporter
MQTVALGWVDYFVLALYVAFVIGIGWVLKAYMKTSADFLTARGSIPAWVTGLAFMSANLGALELVGMAASGAKYGIATAHFYWVGAMPEYLKLRFDERTRALNSITFAVMTVFASGISMNALAKLLNQLLGWNYHIALWITSVVVLIYVLRGGLTSAIYTEVLQFFMIVLGFAPVVWLALKDVGGWGSMNEQLAAVATNPARLGINERTFAPDAWSSAWKPLLGGPPANPMGVDVFAMVFGLGFVLSFGYWCTNFLVVQRAMAAKNMSAARRTPLIAAVPKMLIPALVILPGMLAVSLASMAKDGYRLPPKPIKSYYQVVPTVRAAAESPDPQAAFAKLTETVGMKLDRGKVASLLHEVPTLDDRAIELRVQDSVSEVDYDGVILSLVKKYCPSGLLGLALTALLASFMSGMAGNVTAFNTVWTYDLYQAYLAPKRTDEHYLWMGRSITVVGILLSIACAYFASNYSNAMDVVQLVFGFVNAPLFATFVLGMFWARATAHGAFFGLLGGTATSALFHALTIASGNAPGIKGGYLGVVSTFPSEMAQNFWLASFAFTVCFLLTVGISLATRRTKTDEELKGLVYSMTPRIPDEERHWILRPAVLGAILLGGCVILNVIFW